MTPDQSFTLTVSALGISGALAGIVIGHFLSRSAQHKQWLRDNRKEEFKEVVTAMSKMIVEHMSYVSSQGSDLPQSKQSYVDLMKTTSVVLCDRVYINEDLAKTDIPKRFIETMEHYRDSGTGFDIPNEKADQLIKEVLALAHKG